MGPLLAELDAEPGAGERSGRIALCLVLALGILLTGCSEFATPAELSKPQILAIRADPPSIGPGETSELSILVADHDGEIPAPQVTWFSTPTTPDSEALGTVTIEPDGTAIYTAPTELPMTPTIGTVTATVTHDGGEMQALKAILVGAFPLANPIMTGFTADAQDILEEGRLSVSPGQTVALEVATEPELGDMAGFAWYSTIGEIERYQSNPVELVAQDEPGEGWLFAVVRDGQVGVVWAAVEVTVE